MATRVLTRAPTPQELANAWVDRFGPRLREQAGRDGRISATEARRMIERTDDGKHASDNAVAFIRSQGSKTVSVEKLIGAVKTYVEARASQVAGSSGRVSLVQARMLPKDLQDDYLVLRGRLTEPPALTGAALKSAVTDLVKEALDQGTLEKLSRPPASVRGRKPLIENIPHPASNTRAIVYIAAGKVYVSRASPVPSPLVGWYFAGEVPKP